MTPAPFDNNMPPTAPCTGASAAECCEVQPAPAYEDLLQAPQVGTSKGCVRSGNSDSMRSQPSGSRATPDPPASQPSSSNAEDVVDVARVHSAGTSPMHPFVDRRADAGQQRRAVRRRTKAGKLVGDILLQDLEACFTLPEDTASQQLGIGLTVLKRLCRRFGITRWPYRKLQRLRLVIRKAQLGCLSSGGSCSDMKAVLEELAASMPAESAERMRSQLLRDSAAEQQCRKADAMVPLHDRLAPGNYAAEPRQFSSGMGSPPSSRPIDAMRDARNAQLCGRASRPTAAQQQPAPAVELAPASTWPALLAAALQMPQQQQMPPPPQQPAPEESTANLVTLLQLLQQAAPGGDVSSLIAVMQQLQPMWAASGMVVDVLQQLQQLQQRLEQGVAMLVAGAGGASAPCAPHAANAATSTAPLSLEQLLQGGLKWQQSVGAPAFAQQYAPSPPAAAGGACSQPPAAGPDAGTAQLSLEQLLKVSPQWQQAMAAAHPPAPLAPPTVPKAAPVASEAAPQTQFNTQQLLQLLAAAKRHQSTVPAAAAAGNSSAAPPELLAIVRAAALLGMQQ